MPAAYLTAAEASTRLLGAYSITGAPTQVELELASDALDRMGGYIGEKYVETQLREFPRSVTVRDDTEGQVPQAVKDWVALFAYRLSQEDDAPVKHERLDLLSVTYAAPKRSRARRLMKGLLGPYRTARPRIV